MRDKFSGEAHALFASMGFYKKFEDAGYRNAQTKTMEAQQDPGLADSVLIPTTMGRSFQPIFIEHKTGEGGDRERFTFAKWGERQRQFHVACAWSGIPYYLFLVMGYRIGGKKYPRSAFLMPAERMLEIEVMAAGRKSLSYATAKELLKKEELVWESGRWHMPPHNPLQILLNEQQLSSLKQRGEPMSLDYVAAELKKLGSMQVAVL